MTLELGFHQFNFLFLINMKKYSYFRGPCCIIMIIDSNRVFPYYTFPIIEMICYLHPAANAYLFIFKNTKIKQAIFKTIGTNTDNSQSLFKQSTIMKTSPTDD